MGATGIWLYWIAHRYYFYGKTAATWERIKSEEDKELLGQANKRSWGYGQWYDPQIDISMKKKLYEELGGKKYLDFRKL